MRALLIEPGPQFSVADVFNGVERGLSDNGVQTIRFPLGNWINLYSALELDMDGEYRKAFEYEAACRMASYAIKAAVWDAVPDVVVIVSSFFLPPDLYVNLRERGRHIVLWLTESPYEDERQIPMARFADTVIVNDPTNLDAFRKQNPRTFYVPHSYNPAVHHDHGRTDEHPFSFVGTGYPSRIEFLERADLPDGSVLAGNWQKIGDDSPLLAHLAHERGQCVDNADAADLYRSSACSFNLYRKEAMTPDLVDGWAMGPREVELAATSTFFAREPRGEGDELFPHLPKVTEPGELADVIRWANEHSAERRAAAVRARAAIADRTFVKHTADVLRLIG